MSGAFHYVRLADGRWLADGSRAPWRWSHRERLAFASAEGARRARDAVAAAWNGAEVVSEAPRAGGEPWLERALATGWKYAPAKTG